MEAESASILIVAHQTAAGPTLIETVRDRASESPCQFHLLVPRRVRTGERIDNPELVGKYEAEDVLRDALPTLSKAAGSEVTGEIGGFDPFMSVEEAIADKHYDEVIISTLPIGLSRWLKHDLVSRVEELGVPVRHVQGIDSRLLIGTKH